MALPTCTYLLLSPWCLVLGVYLLPSQNTPWASSAAVERAIVSYALTYIKLFSDRLKSRDLNFSLNNIEGSFPFQPPTKLSTHEALLKSQSFHTLCNTSFFHKH